MTTHLIAELGQNHQGSIDIAHEMLDLVIRPRDVEHGEASSAGFDSVKVCVRDLAWELTADAAAKPYTGRNSFGATYGEHRAALELSWGEHADLCYRAQVEGLGFIVTACQPTVVESCPFVPSYWKVASRDLTNEPLLDALREHPAPVILSTGMHTLEEVWKAVDRVHPAVVMHCTSVYPCEPEDVNLRRLEALGRLLTGTETELGFSDHTVGIQAGALAVALGATFIEKHVTLWRGMRGTDQRGALGPEGVWRYARAIREAEAMLGNESHPYAVQEARNKLERSVSSRWRIPAGKLIGEEDLVLLSPGDGFRWSSRSHFLGKIAQRDIPSRTTLKLADVTPVD